MSGSEPVTSGVSREVWIAAAATACGVVPLVPGFSQEQLPTGTLFLVGWPAFGIGAAILLDRDPGSRLGRLMVGLAVLPVPLALLGLATIGGSSGWSGVAAVAERIDLMLVVAVLASLGWAVGIAPDRASRRRLVWLVAWAAALVVALTLVSLRGTPRALAVVTVLGLWAMTGLLVRLVTTRGFRPIDEPLMDVAAVLLALVVGAGVGVVVRVIGERAGIPQLELSAAFAAVVTVALAWPSALWLRRTALERRYGKGTLSQADVAAITADLDGASDPRQLLAKAATIVAAATGHRSVQLFIGPDEPELPAGWVGHPLLVGGDRVGTMLIQPRHPEGPELRQEQIVDQMLPTIALTARAVQLAVEEEQARQDVARERDAERSRILGDLHDGLGPVLAGMSMRVQAEIRRSPTPLLSALADELADARGDLRRIVSGLAPSALDDTTLREALASLIDTFGGEEGEVVIETGLPGELAPEVSVAVYLSVAEGVTNALRHGHAGHVTVRVHHGGAGQVHVDVHDDGVGGPIVPGVGLTSLRRRAEQLGGSLAVVPRTPNGVHLHLELPVAGAA